MKVGCSLNPGRKRKEPASRVQVVREVKKPAEVEEGMVGEMRRLREEVRFMREEARLGREQAKAEGLERRGCRGSDC